MIEISLIYISRGELTNWHLLEKILILNKKFFLVLLNLFLFLYKLSSYMSFFKFCQIIKITAGAS